MRDIFNFNLIRLTVIGFLVFVLCSMYFYPGGNIHDESQVGYSFSHNFLSDLGAYSAHNGEVNFLSSVFFAFSLSICFFAGIAFLNSVPPLFKEDGIDYWIALAGSLFIFFGMAFFALVGLTPHDLYFDEHVFFALNSFRLLIPATLLYLFLMFKNKGIDKTYAYVILFLLLAITAYVTYEIFSGSPMESESEMVRHATLQKIIVLINIICMYFITYAFESKKTSSLVY